MPAITESSLKAAFTEYATTSLLPALAKKYGFDAEEEARALNLDDIKVTKTTSKGGKAKKTEGDKPKVKRGPTGYLLFQADVRSTIKSELEAELEEGEKLKPQRVVTEGAKRWKELSKEEQQPASLPDYNPACFCLGNMFDYVLPPPNQMRRRSRAGIPLSQIEEEGYMEPQHVDV